MVKRDCMVDAFAKNDKVSGQGSLRVAITTANAEPGRGVITLAPTIQGVINVKVRCRHHTAFWRSEVRDPTSWRYGATSLSTSTVTISGLTVSNRRKGG